MRKLDFTDFNKKTYLFPTLIIAVLLILLSFTIFAFASGQEIRNNNHQYLLNDTKETAKDINNIVKDGQTGIQILSQIISQSLTSEEVDIAEYQKLIQHSVFDFIEFADKDGQNHNITGGITDAKDRKYYTDAMSGNSGMEIVFHSRATHETLINFYAPVYYNGEIVGSLVGVYQASNKISAQLNHEYFGTDGTSYLCTANGFILASNTSVDTDLYPSITDVMALDDANIDVLEKAFTTRSNATFFTEGKRATGCVYWVEDSDFVLVQTFPVDVNMRMFRKMNAIVIGLLFMLSSIFIMMLVVVVRTYRQQQRKVDVAMQTERQQLAVMNSMSEAYYSMHRIDLVHNCVSEFKAENQVESIVGNSTDAAKAMIDVIHATITDNYLSIALDFSDIKTLPKRMQHKKFLSTDLKGKNVGWIRMAFTTINSDEKGFPTDVIITTQIIDDEKKREEQLKMESNTDELTGCLNRRAYEEDLLLYPNVPPEKDFVFVAMDINGLKVVNDSKGHAAGDELILGAAECMKQCIGNYGRIYRTGGDEFCAIIFISEDALEHMKTDFEEVQEKWTGNLVDSLSISSGYVSKREYEDKTVAELAKIADQRMYEAKAKYYQAKGIDRRGQAAAHTALCNLYKKILKINITEDSYQIVNMDVSEQTATTGFDPKISKWLRGFAETGNVHPEDLENYYEKTDIEFLAEYFSKNTSLTIIYRRKSGETFIPVTMELIPANDYAYDNQTLFLYVK